jgi:hypothetical protein
MRNVISDRSLKGLARLHLLLLWLLAAGVAGTAQQVTSTLSGTIRDTSGAVIPQAALTATNTSTGIGTRTTSDDAGRYIFPSLPPGTYSLAVQKTGFQTTVIPGVTLTVYQKATVDAALEVGRVTQRVEVAGAAPLLSTTSASIGTVLQERQIFDLPLNLRRTSSLALLVPGVSDTSGNSLTSASGNGSGFNTTSFSAAGGASSSNLVLVDGMPNRALNNGGFALDLPPEMVKEFNIQNNVYDASFGIAAGSVMNTVTQSGTNLLHGSVWEYLRNQVLDARNFFALDQTNPVTGADIPGTARPSYQRNQFGFALGGPLRKEKMFFFVSYEGLRQIQGQSSTAVVPTTAEENGDFSSFLTGQTANLCGAGGPANLNFDTGQLFYPASEYLVNCPAASALAGSTVLTGQPIPGNLITSLDPVAQKVLPSYPAPNSPGVLNYINQTPYRESDNTGLVRLDANISSKDQLFGRYMIGRSNDFYPGPFNPFNESQYYQGQNMVLGWTHTFGPNLINEARVGYSHNYLDRDCAECPHPPGTLAGFGIQGVRASTPQTEIDPYFTFVNFAPWGDYAFNPDIVPDSLEMLGDALTKIHGRHTFAAGATLYFYQILGYEDPAQLNGAINFNGQYSSLAGEIPNVSTVSDLADLELGYPASGNYMEHAFVNNFIGGGWFNVFAQDNIRVSPRLSLEVGVRWEYRKQPYDKHNLISTFFPLSNSYTPGDALLLTGLPDAANDALCSQPYFISATGECLVMTSAERVKYGFTGGKRREVSLGGGWDSFAPRVGVSWRPTQSDKLVVHAGSGIFYDLPETNQLVAYNNNSFVFAPTLLFAPPFGAPPLVTNGAPTTTETMFANAGSATVPLSQVTGQLDASPLYFTPTVYEWSTTIDSQFAPNWALEVGYIGNRGVHTGVYHTYANQAKPGVGDLQPRRVWPDFGTFVYNTYDGMSNYNAMTVRLTKRLSQGLSALVSYTWAKEMDFNGGDSSEITLLQNDNDPRADYSVGDIDTPQRLVISPVWQLPFGSGQHFLNHKGLANALAGGWEFSGILTFQSGTPYTVYSPQDYSNTGSTSPRPDRVCNGAGPGTVAEWFNTNCFTLVPLALALANGTPRFGNSGRNILFGPGLNEWDIGLMKRTQIRERLALQFRAQFFNLFNRANFGLPGSAVGTSTAGLIGSARTPRDIQFGLKLEF